MFFNQFKISKHKKNLQILLLGGGNKFIIFLTIDLMFQNFFILDRSDGGLSTQERSNFPSMSERSQSLEDTRASDYLDPDSGYRSQDLIKQEDHGTPAHLIAR